ncbi:MAG: peptidoglycan DD-metalloendopeptidase family protein [Candidatus Parcubacteria bacterium]|nr:peptidoglycan DD-metalloendopeptidase family protein [Burkholderiales bacterium]
MIFVAGAVFGAFAFFVVTSLHPAPSSLPAAELPPQVAPPAVAAPVITTPPVAEGAFSAPRAGSTEALADATRAAVPVASVADEPPAKALILPVLGVATRQLSDTFNEVRGGTRRHEALDILAPRGTPVIAADDGKIVKLFKSVPGGLTIYQFDPEEKLVYYYAHLDGYAAGVVEGKLLKRGELIGYVGTTGNANPATPHLHFAIFELGPEKRWWKGTAINPYPLLTGR